MIHSKYRFLIPNGLTFLSLICGTGSILLSASTSSAADAPRHLWLAGLLILASYCLDLWDGIAARRLNASSAFGLQLDSLVDMVSLGLAPAVFLFTYLLQVARLRPEVAGPLIMLVPLAGAFRLARFNLLPPKTTGKTDSVGLTISTGGAILTVAVLVNLSGPVDVLATPLYLPLAFGVSLLMVSTIPFPSLASLFAARRTRVAVLVLVGASLLFMSLWRAWFVWALVYIGFALGRAIYRRCLGQRAPSSHRPSAPH